MNQQQFVVLVQNFIAMVSGFAIGHGWVTSNDAVLIGGFLTALAPFVWAYLEHTNFAKLKAAANLPDVKTIVIAEDANRSIAAAAADPAQPKIIKESSAAGMRSRL